MQHVGDDTLEQYAMATMPDAELGPVEEHLLTCQSCRDRLHAEIDFVAAMRGAAASLRADEQA